MDPPAGNLAPLLSARLPLRHKAVPEPLYYVGGGMRTVLARQERTAPQAIG